MAYVLLNKQINMTFHYNTWRTNYLTDIYLEILILHENKG